MHSACIREWIDIPNLNSVARNKSKKGLGSARNAADTILPRNVFPTNQSPPFASNKWCTDFAEKNETATSRVVTLSPAPSKTNFVWFREECNGRMFLCYGFEITSVSFVKEIKANTKRGNGLLRQFGILLHRLHLVQLQLLRSLCLRHMQYTAGIIDLPPFCPTRATSSFIRFSESSGIFRQRYLIGVATRIVPSENRRSTDVCSTLFIHEIYPQNLVAIHIYLDLRFSFSD